MGTGPERVDLDSELKGLCNKGICTEPENLKLDMVRQFSDPMEWVREYAANAYDAGATWVRFSGRAGEDFLVITVEDDGRGMDRQRVLDFMCLFRSPDDASGFLRRIGRHGIGKLSVAAVDGQSGFLMVTCTGTECWRLTAGCLLKDAPAKLERLEPGDRPRGSRFDITFTCSRTLRDELSKIRQVLWDYCRFLPLDIVVRYPDEPGTAAPHEERVRDVWAARNDGYGHEFCQVMLGSRRYDIALSVGPGGHEVYQERVLISKTYDLLSWGASTPVRMPHIRVRVTSADFEVPFGRHRLTNEDVLAPLAAYLRDTLLPEYVRRLCTLYENNLLAEYEVAPQHVEEIACAMMAFNRSPAQPWAKIRLFRVCNRPRMSFASLIAAAGRHKHLFVEDQQSPGIDYQAFPAPVLASQQAAGAMEALQKLLSAPLVNLSDKDVVLEASDDSTPELGPREKSFQKFLGFHPDAVRRALDRSRSDDEQADRRRRRDPLGLEARTRLTGISQEARLAQIDLTEMRWRVNWLVQRDGKTPCVSHRFLLKDHTVVVNLHHPDIVQLLALAEKAPALAGHWGLAMCLSDTRRILAHLSPAACEELILADAIAKCGVPEPGDADGSDLTPNDDSWQDFRRDLEDDGLGLG